MEDPSPDDAGQTTGKRSRRAGRDEGGSRTLRRSAASRRMYEEIRSSRDPRGTMWKTASVLVPHREDDPG